MWSGRSSNGEGNWEEAKAFMPGVYGFVRYGT